MTATSTAAAPRSSRRPRTPWVGAAAATACTAALVAGCASGTTGDQSGTPARPSVSVPVSADVTAPAGPVDRTAPGAALSFGQSAYLPANAFRPAGQLVMVTPTGVEPGVAGDLPESVTDGGTPFYVHVTFTSLVDRVVDVPSVVGLAGSPDGRTATRSVDPPGGLRQCVQTDPPKNPTRGQSWATCFIAVADKGVDVNRVIYWAQTTTDPADDYKATPVVWSTPGTPAASSAPTS
ncbi:hypothetical protein [Williamsia serinedens]|uniref:hypothetical protein n=1 Tax=Williamsia serinedens TaxID=391736 RepID=UPI0020A3E7F7|nr:hypothetical protein [Williamsia serinedens]